jgi:hypothetical protein
VQVLQRPDCYGSPVDLGELFVVQKHARRTCRIHSHQFGWEMRALNRHTEVVQTQVCRSPHDVLTTGEQWKATMIEKGWT